MLRHRGSARRLKPLIPTPGFVKVNSQYLRGVGLRSTLVSAQLHISNLLVSFGVTTETCIDSTLPHPTIERPERHSAFVPC